MSLPKCLIPLLFLLSLTKADVSEILTGHCPSTTYTASNSSYRSNIETVLSSLSSNSSHNLFYASSAGNLPGQVIQGLYQCRGDLSVDRCQICVSGAAKDILQVCPGSTDGWLFYDDCLLRFSDEPIVSVPSTNCLNCYYGNPENVTESERAKFNSFVRATLNESATEAADKESKFVARQTRAAGNLSNPQSIYTLVQCTQDLSPGDCISCLQDAILLLSSCCDGRLGGRVVLPSCNFHYEVYPFYNTTPPPPPSPPPRAVDVPSSLPIPVKSGNQRASLVTIIGILAGLCILFLAASTLVGCYFRAIPARKRASSLQEGEDVDEIITVESLQYDLATIRNVTGNFCDANKIGQGGFGAVYKGTLPNGQDIAVKRLSLNSNQGDLEFNNEVLLVAKLQHRNLVRLLGFCLERGERILIYEFVLNASLDRFLFDPNKRRLLTWESRHKIVEGIARGLLYLHEDSRLRIIHRDLKASNVLIDNDMRPKISDFGMARLFVMDQTQDNTSRIVGTYGYMAPEYARRGHFSPKSDVFSFGVLMLEIVSGQKNSNVHNRGVTEDLLGYAWKNWREGTMSNMIDPILGDGSRNEIMRCIHIGLLCVQENEVDRPTMASVVLMVNSYSLTLPMPSQPAFFANTMPIRGRDSSLTGSNSSTFEVASLSMNDASISDMYPR